MAVTPRIEFRFLAELRFTASNAAYYFHHLQQESAKWTAAHAESERLSKLGPRERAKWDANAFAEHMATQLRAQTEFLAHLDALLACLGRIALILFGQGNKPPALVVERTTHLRELLAVPTDSLLGQKQLRNAWTHYDEYLDELPETLSTDTAFIAGQELDSPPKALRRLAIAERVVDFAGVGRFELDALSRLVDELRGKVDQAISTWAERRQPTQNHE